MRIHINRHNPLPLEKSVQLPAYLQKQVLAEAVRFGIVDGIVGQQARDALFKAFYRICWVLQVDKMVVCARFPVHKRYLGLLFEDVFPSGEYIEMAHIGCVPHRLLMLQVDQVEPIWRENNHSLYSYFFQTHHPDINAAIDSMGGGHSQ